LSPLTPRERQVLDALVAGASTQEISQLLVVSQYAVRYHLKNLFRKFHVRRRSQLVASAVRLGLTSQTGQALTAPTTPSG
jgi:DNA-binding CsgD family transcriptional regulator